MSAGPQDPFLQVDDDTKNMDFFHDQRPVNNETTEDQSQVELERSDKMMGETDQSGEQRDVKETLRATPEDQSQVELEMMGETGQSGEERDEKETPCPIMVRSIKFLLCRYFS